MNGWTKEGILPCEHEDEDEDERSNRDQKAQINSHGPANDDILERLSVHRLKAAGPSCARENHF